MEHRAEGFDEEILIVLPQTVVDDATEHPLFGGVLAVAAGFFPAAEGHLVERVSPISEAIFILCVEGSGWVRVGDGETENVAADTVVYIPANLPHSYGADERTPWSIYWFHARGREMAAYAELLGLSADNPVLPLPAGTAAPFYFSSVIEPLAQDYTVANLLNATSRIRVALAEIFHRQTRGRSTQPEEPVERTITWMRSHLAERVELAQLARLAGLSIAQYSAIFRRMTGYSPIDYFIRLKVQHAARLLDRTAMRIDEVAADVGYEDAFYFSRLFRRIMAQSPREYRATKKG